MNDRPIIVGRRVKGFSGMRMHLSPYAETGPGQLQPEPVQPVLIEFEAHPVPAVHRVDAFRHEVRVAPRSNPEDLTLPSTTAATAVLRERLAEHRIAKPQAPRSRHRPPPLTALGLSNSCEPSCTPASPSFAVSEISVPSSM